jgi:hypothetical protein
MTLSEEGIAVGCLRAALGRVRSIAFGQKR